MINVYSQIYNALGLSSEAPNADSVSAEVEGFLSQLKDSGEPLLGASHFGQPSEPNSNTFSMEPEYSADITEESPRLHETALEYLDRLEKNLTNIAHQEDGSTRNQEHNPLRHSELETSRSGSEYNENEQSKVSEIYGFFANAIYKLSYKVLKEHQSTVGLQASSVLPEADISINLVDPAEQRYSPRMAVLDGARNSYAAPTLQRSFADSIESSKLVERSVFVLPPEQYLRKKLSLIEKGGQIQIILRDYQLPEKVLDAVVERLKLIDYADKYISSVIINGAIKYQKT